jgi:alginate O-acetyltransferase complex protein AlgI
MVFSSMTFLWVFLPIVFVATMLLRKIKLQNICLLITSLFFYAWGEPRYVFLMIFSIFMNWLFGMLIDRFDARKKLFLVLDIICNLALLGYFKYTDFAIVTIDRLFHADIPVAGISLPIGISFFTFQAMSYVIDLYRGKYKVQRNILNLALYISFFPQLIAGPIVQYKDIDDQIEDRVVSVEKVASGFRRFAYGLGKKVIISNLVAVASDNLFHMDVANMTGAMAWCAALFYTLQIYYDFSGYSDMAIGLGRIFGFEFLENFNYPYISGSIREFWRRWHISLSSWFRDYVYIPLGGNRKGTFRTYLNNVIVFFLTGLWHGAAWNFVLWGMYHGFFIIIERLGLGRVLKKSRVISHIYAMFVVAIGWVFFNVTSVHHGVSIVARMLLPWRYTESLKTFGELVSLQSWLAVIAGIIGCGILQTVFAHGAQRKIADWWKGSAAEGVWLAVVVAVSIVLLANNTYNPFIYFRF